MSSTTAGPSTNPFEIAQAQLDEAATKLGLDEPMREMRETAKVVRDAADPTKIMAEADAEQRVLDDAAKATPAHRTSQNDWAAPTPGTADTRRGGATPFEGVLDPGSSQVATPGEPPANADHEL